MKLLGYLFAVLGFIAFIAVLCGYEHQILMACIGGVMAYTILSESKHEETRR